MSERTKRYDLSLETETIIGNFTLHLVTDPNLVPRESSVHLISREYVQYEDPEKRLPILREARLDLEEDENGLPHIVGTIDFDTPTAYQKQPEGMIAYNLQRGILDKFHKTLVGREINIHSKGGFSIVERRRPIVEVKISHADLLQAHLELSSKLSPNLPKSEKLQDIISVATQWVELQEMIVQLNELPYLSRKQHDIYLDMGTEAYVSQIELAIMSALATYESLGSRTPQWDHKNFIDSHTLTKMEQAVSAEKVQESAQELIHSIRTFDQATNYMEPISQDAIVNALSRSLRNRKQGT